MSRLGYNFLVQVIVTDTPKWTIRLKQRFQAPIVIDRSYLLFDNAIHSYLSTRAMSR